MPGEGVMPGNWIVVAAAEHIARGRAGGFMQAGHGKLAPLRRLRPGDRVAAYSPSRVFHGDDRLQAFTGLAIVAAGEPYQADMGEGFHPFRRDVAWLDAQEAPIQKLLDRLEFTTGKTNWGYPFRRGLFGISDHDMALIAEAMGASLLSA
jgi:hypothetical protein